LIESTVEHTPDTLRAVARTGRQEGAFKEHAEHSREHAVSTVVSWRMLGCKPKKQSGGKRRRWEAMGAMGATEAKENGW
jgi:hypothetical protein